MTWASPDCQSPPPKLASDSTRKTCSRACKAVNEKAEKTDCESAAQKVVSGHGLDAKVAPEFAPKVSHQRGGNDEEAVRRGDEAGIPQSSPMAVTDEGRGGQGVGKLGNVRHVPPSVPATPSNVRHAPPLNRTINGQLVRRLSLGVIVRIRPVDLQGQAK